MLSLLLGALVWSEYGLADHLRFTKVTLAPAQTAALLHVGRAAQATDAMVRLLAAWPEVHGIAGLARVDPRVPSQAITHYASVLNEVEATYIPVGLPPASRPLADRPLIVTRANAPPAVLLHEAMHYAIDVAAGQEPRRSSRIAVHDAFKNLTAKAGPGDEPELAARGLELVRRTQLEEVEIVLFTLRHRGELKLTSAFVVTEVRHANEQLNQAAHHIQELVPLLADHEEGLAYKRRRQEVVDEILEIDRAITAAACELALY